MIKFIFLLTVNCNLITLYDHNSCWYLLELSVVYNLGSTEKQALHIQIEMLKLYSPVFHLLTKGAPKYLEPSI